MPELEDQLFLQLHFKCLYAVGSDGYIQLVLVEVSTADLFSVPSASTAFSISPAKVMAACCGAAPPVSYTRTTYSSDTSAFSAL